MKGPPPLPKAMLSRSATTATKPVIPAKAWKKIEAESGVSLSKLKKPVATISQHVQLKVASLDLEKHMGDQHVELHIHWQCSNVMDIPIATAFTMNLQVATTVVAQWQGIEFCHRMFK
ncbi:unnamed protein product [Sphagnum troendelagicum]